jgi:5'-phosphate synthase pdxT subunit
VVALQGDFALHMAVLNDLGVDAREVRTVRDLAEADALVLPGGESTTLRHLMKREGLWEAIREKHAKGTPVFGTCAGLILMARSIEQAKPGEDTLNLLGVTVRRNAYGRQKESFVGRVSLNLDSDAPKVLDALFIRAPAIVSVSPDVRVLGEHRGSPVLVAGEAAAGATFHPEAVPSPVIHRWFLQEFLKVMI